MDREGLGLTSETGIAVRVEDGRLGLRHLAAGSRDLVVGDAFGGVSVPWHLTTSEAMADIRRVLQADGVYVANLIDYGDLAFMRAEVATVEQVFDHVVLVGEPNDVGVDPASASVGGNFVVLASDRRIDPRAIRDALDAYATQWAFVADDDVGAWIGDAQVLTDDHAPVDQLVEPNRPRSRQ